MPLVARHAGWWAARRARSGDGAICGAELFICQFHDFARPETLRLFADGVLPALA